MSLLISYPAPWHPKASEPPLFIQCDLTDIEALQTAVKHALAIFGTVDVLVNNAANDQRHTIQEVTPAYWDRSIATNLRPQFFMLRP